MMKEYETISALKDDFVSGEYTPNEPVKVGNNVYKKGYTSSHDRFGDIFNENNKGVVVLESENGWLMFLWGANGNTIIPYDVRPTTMPLTEADASAIEERIIPDKVEVHFLNMPISGSVVGKVDTGAEMCSLHAENVQVNRGEGTVTFVCPQLSHSRLTVPPDVLIA